jgi:hypothetical protein
MQACFVGLDVIQRWSIPLCNIHASVGVCQPFHLMMETDAVFETFLKFIYFLNIKD